MRKAALDPRLRFFRDPNCKTILLVEDHPIVAQVIIEIVQRGLDPPPDRIVWVQTLMEALTALDGDCRPDVALIDPGLDATQAMATIGPLLAHPQMLAVPVVIVSGTMDAEHLTLALEHWAYVGKGDPLFAQHLLEAIYTTCGKANRIREILWSRPSPATC